MKCDLYSPLVKERGCAFWHLGRIVRVAYFNETLLPFKKTNKRDFRSCNRRSCLSALNKKVFATPLLVFLPTRGRLSPVWPAFHVARAGSSSVTPIFFSVNRNVVSRRYCVLQGDGGLGGQFQRHHLPMPALCLVLL